MAGINFKAFDLGGHEIARRVWKDYYAKVCIAIKQTLSQHLNNSNRVQSSVTMYAAKCHRAMARLVCFAASACFRVSASS